MQNPGGDEIQRSAYKRVWVQRGGPRPANALRYAGADGSYIEIGDATIPIRGITREQQHDPSQLGAYTTVAVIESPPDFATGQVMFKNKRGSLPWVDFDQQCEYNLYQPIGYCRSPGDFSNGWETGVLILSRGRPTQVVKQGLAKFSEDVAGMNQVDTTWTGGVYEVGTLFFEQEGADEVVRQIVDVTYFLSQGCGQCGPANDGTRWRYALQQDDGASTGIVGQVIYTVDDGVTYTASNITSLGGNDTVSAIDGMAGALIVLSPGGNSYHYAYVDELTGAPGAWSEVDTGFVATFTPNDLYVASPTEAFIAADGGYVYALRRVGGAVEPLLAGSITSENLTRVDGCRDTVVAVGENRTIVFSRNRGRNWQTPGAIYPSSANLSALLVIDEYLWYIGTDDGVIYYTQTGGEEWTSLGFPGSGTGQVWDIVGATPEVIYFSHSTATPDARLFASITGGAVFDLSTASNQQRMSGWPTFDHANRLAVPKLGTLATKANHLFIGGLAGNGTDGILLSAAPNVEFS